MSDLLDIIQRINKLSKKEKIHILSILRQEENIYTKNANGYFFNLADVSDETYERLKTCVELIESNRDVIREMNIRRDETISYYKALIEEKLLKTLNEKKQLYMDSITLRQLNSNITIDTSRVWKIKYRNTHNVDIDPDDLMKKPKIQYRKDSVCYKLNEILKKSTRNANLRPKSNTKRLFYTCDEGEDNFDVDHENEDIEEEMDPDVDLYNDDENDVEGEFDDANNDINDNNIDEETLSDEEENVTSEDVVADAKEIEQTLVFYKRLLHSRGFVFMDENYVLEKQAYIT
jgi:hypothetical protein